MTFRFRTFPEIRDSMLASVAGNSEVDDTNVGSINRTIIEAAALSDADQYVQLARLRQAFSFRDASEADLVERGLDVGLPRTPPRQSIGTVVFRDSRYTTKVETTLAVGLSPGNTSVTVASASAFPATGSLVLDRGNSARELVTYSSKAGNVFTLTAPVANAHSIGASVILSNAGVDRPLVVGTQVFVPATEDTEQLDFTLTSNTTILDGDVVSAPANVTSVGAGAVQNVGTGRIIGVTSPPFPTCTVTNEAPALQGSDVEEVETYRSRILSTIASLGSYTTARLEAAALEVSLDTGQRVVFARSVDEFTDPDVSLYIDDGNGTASSTADVTSLEVLLHKAEPGQRRAHLANWPVQTLSNLALAKSAHRGTATVSLGVGTATLTDASAAYVVNELAGLTLIDANKNTFIVASNTATAIVVTVPGLINPLSGVYAVLPATSLAPGDYLFDETTGDLELTVGLLANDALVVRPFGVGPSPAYTYFTGLIQEVQRVVNGVPNDDDYPGVRPPGIKVKVRSPSQQLFSFQLAVSSSAGTVDAALTLQVEEAIQAYVNGLGIGNDVIIAEVVAAVMAIPGVTDVNVISPTSNIVVLDNVLPRTNSSLITVF